MNSQDLMLWYKIFVKFKVIFMVIYNGAYILNELFLEEIFLLFYFQGMDA